MISDQIIDLNTGEKYTTYSNASEFPCNAESLYEKIAFAFKSQDWIAFFPYSCGMGWLLYFSAYASKNSMIVFIM